MFPTESIRREVTDRMISNQTLLNPLKQPCRILASVGMSSARDALFDLLNYKTIFARSVSSPVEAMEGK